MKRILSILIAVLILFVTGCGQTNQLNDNEPSKDNPSESTTTQSTDSASDSSDQATSALDTDQITLEINDALAVISENEANTSAYTSVLKSLDTYSDAHEVASQDIGTISLQTDTVPIDLSYSFQWMSDHYDDLSEEDQKLFDNFTPLPKGLTSTTSQNNQDDSLTLQLSQLLSMDVLADEVPAHFEELYVENPNLYIYCDSYDIGSLAVPAVYQALQKSLSDYKDIVGTDRKYTGVILLKPMVPSVESMSFMKFVPQADGSELNVFYMVINSSMSDDLTRAAIYHELFHLYQASAGFFTDNAKDRFLVEATSIWAVSKMEETLKYHERYTKDLYENPSLDFNTMSIELMKSWYQLFYFIDQEKGDPDLVKSLFKTYKTGGNISAALLESTGKALRVHNLFAYFTAYLFEEGTNNTLSIKPNSPFLNHSFGSGVYTTKSHEDLVTANGVTFDSYSMEKPGFKAFMVNEPTNRNALLDIMVNLEQLKTRDKIGMVVYKESIPGMWEPILSGRYDNFVADQVDFQNSDSKRIAVLFFNYDFNEPATQAYRWDYVERLVGEGYIDIYVKRSKGTEEGSPEASFEFSEHLALSEDLERYKVKGTEETAAMSDLMMGEVFFVNHMTASYNSNYSSEDLLTQTKRSSKGMFTYSDGDLGPNAFTNNMFTLPDLSMPEPQNPNGGGSGSLQDMMDQAMEGLGSLEGLGDMELPGMPDMSGISEEAGQLQREINSLESILADPNSMLSSLMGSLDKLIRTKETPESQLFLFYQTLPNNIHADPWLKTTELYTFTNAEGERETETKEWFESLPSDIIPLWFYNYNFDMEKGQEFANKLSTDPADYEDVDAKWTMDQIAYINGAFNKENLYQCLNDGTHTVPIEEVNPNFNIGLMTQNLTFKNGIFNGDIEANYEDTNGEKVTVNIIFRYDFTN